ncbi:transmembrane signal receptor [Lithospermum erythrorhizon]|uniref:non-specific serine/threonine protein kinase n=1 Tax=Lithospermum erythrorhizon TaxID=34254 RepID=A0AAV3QZB1_LITER
MTQQLTDKSDVFGFGVVLLELITARNPIEKGIYVVKAVRETMNKSKILYNLHSILDQGLASSMTTKSMERFVDLAMKCVEEGVDRPTMSEVVKEIESIMESVRLVQHRLQQLLQHQQLQLAMKAIPSVMRHCKT